MFPHPKKIIRFFQRIVVLLPSKVFRSRNRRRLSNQNPTIISNNCIAGIILHDLNLRFNTPTINMIINRTDFIRYVNNLKSYSGSDLVEKNNSGKKYPVGILKGEAGEVEIEFMHYESFEAAKEKWVERSKRIDYDNIFIIMEGGSDIPVSLIHEFETIPYRNKVIITDAPHPKIKNAFYMSIYDENYYPGMILAYEGLSGRRYLDRFDYVEFLNQT